MESTVKDKLKAVADNVRCQRLEKNYSQVYVAKRLGIPQSTYSKIEIAYTRMTVEMLYKIAAILELPIDKLLRMPLKTPDLKTKNDMRRGPLKAQSKHL